MKLAKRIPKSSTQSKKIAAQEKTINLLRQRVADSEQGIEQLKSMLHQVATLSEVERRLRQLETRLDMQVNRFEQLMSKLFRKERREALALEIEKLDNGSSL